MKKLNLIFIFCFLIGGCATVPTQLKDAMNLQRNEINNVKEMYITNVKNLLDSIKKYRLEVIDMYEQTYLAKYSKAFDLKIDAQGIRQAEEISPTGDPNVDHIRLSTLKKIRDFFDEQREKVHEDIAERRKQYNLIHANFKNIETVNLSVSEYINSLSRLKNARDAAAQSLARKVIAISPIPVNLAKLPDPTTIKGIVKAFNP